MQSAEIKPEMTFSHSVLHEQLKWDIYIFANVNNHGSLGKLFMLGPY